MLMISKYLVTLAYLHSTIEQMESTRQRASRQFVSLSPLFPFPILSLSILVLEYSPFPIPAMRKSTQLFSPLHVVQYGHAANMHPVAAPLY